MAKKKTKYIPVVEESPEPEVPNEEILDELPEVSALKAELGEGDFSVRVYRQTDDGSFEKFPTVAFDEFDADAIVQHYGGGKWRFEIVNSESRWRKRFTVNYSKAIKPRGEKTEAEPAPDNHLSLVVQLMQSQQAQAQAAAVQLQQAMTEIIKAVAGQPKGPSLQDTILALKGLKDMSEPKNDAATEMVKSIIPMFGKFVEMGRETAESSSPVDVLINKVATALPDFLERLGTLRKPGLPPVRRVEHRPAEPASNTSGPSGQPSAQPKASEVEARYPAVFAAMKQMGPGVMAEAQKNTPAESVAQAIVGQAPQALDEELFAFSTDSRAADFIFQIYPPLAVYSDWVKKLLRAIASEFEEVPVPDPATPEIKEPMGE